jgi:hypothetical protein
LVAERGFTQALPEVEILKKKLEKKYFFISCLSLIGQRRLAGDCVAVFFLYLGCWFVFSIVNLYLVVTVS